MDKQNFIKLVNAYIADYQYENKLINALASCEIVYEHSVASPLVKYAEDTITECFESLDVDVLSAIFELAEFGNTIICGKEIFSAEDLWNALKAE